MVVIRQIDAAYVQDNSGVITPYRLIEASGLSTDTKPTANVSPSSLFLELDTNKIYYFDGQNWNEVGTANMISDNPIVAPIGDGGESPIV